MKWCAAVTVDVWHYFLYSSVFATASTQSPQFINNAAAPEGFLSDSTRWVCTGSARRCRRRWSGRCDHSPDRASATTTTIIIIVIIIIVPYNNKKLFCRAEAARCFVSVCSLFSIPRAQSFIMPPDPVGNGAISVAFVRPSVSVVYIVNNSRTQGLAT